MESALARISLPRVMKGVIQAKLRENRFSRPANTIRSLIREDQDLTGKAAEARLLRRSRKLAARPSRTRARKLRS